MIKNIVFDMGNVLLDYNPEVSLKLFVEKEEDRVLIRKELFEGPEWKEADRGSIRDAEKFEGVSKRVPERLHAQLRQCVDQWDICMVPLPGAREFCTWAKEKGYGIYVLSNASDLFYRYFPNFAPFFFFDGILVSADVHLLKPDVQIFQHFLNTYGLKAEECLFLDDRRDNVEGAARAGMQSVVFRGSFEEIRECFSL